MFAAWLLALAASLGALFIGESNNVRQTPIVLVNGKPLASFGPQQLYDLGAG